MFETTNQTNMRDLIRKIWDITLLYIVAKPWAFKRLDPWRIITQTATAQQPERKGCP
jgi:hypothetical protein